MHPLPPVSKSALTPFNVVAHHIDQWHNNCHKNAIYLQEAILEEQESQKDDNIHLTRFLRVLANFLVLCCLAGSGYLIYFVVRRSQKFALDGLENHTWWERNEVATRNKGNENSYRHQI